MRRTSSFSRISQESVLQDAIAKARNALGRGDAHAAVRDLSTGLGDQRAFRDAILILLDSSLGRMGQELIKEARGQRPDFDLNAHNKEGKTALDLAVRHDDQEFARYLLSQGARLERTSLGAASDGMQALLTAWRRKNLLYAHFNERNRRSWTPLDRVLYEGRHEEARARLEDIIAKNGVPKVWEEAMEAGLDDVLRALLVVGTPNELRELTKQKHLVGKWKEALRADPGLSAVLREFPYQSTEREKIDEFEESVEFTDNGEPIDCRYLAAHQQEQQAQDPRIKFDYRQFSSPEKIADNVKPGIRKTYQVLKAQASETHLISNRRFGQFLARQFEAIEKDGKQSRLMLVESTNHVMNLGLLIKEDEKSYVVKFFDSDETTTTGTRSKANSVQTFETQTLASYITDEMGMKSKYPEPRGMSMIFVRPEENAQASTSISTGSRVGKTLTSIDVEEIDATVVWHLMNEGFDGNLRQLRAHFITLSEAERIALVMARDSDGNSALYMSMQNGNAEAINAYGELMALTSIPEDLRIALLAGKNDKGVPALVICMCLGYAEAVKAYGELLKTLPPDKQADFLLAKISSGPSQGLSGLQGALGGDQFKAANAQLRLLYQLVPALSPEKRAELRKELKDHEIFISISELTNLSSPQQWSEMKRSFSALKLALRR